MRPDRLRLLEAGYQQKIANSQASRQQTQKPEKKKRNFWLDQISTGTGIIGGVGGGILGALGGGIGAVPGAAIGGGAGSALGEAIENLIDPESGDWGNVAEEGALGAIFSAGPLKLGKAALGTRAALQGTEEVAGQGLKAALRAGSKEAEEFTLRGALKGGAKAATKEGAIGRTSRGLLGDAWGIRSGVKTAGKTVTPQRAGELQKFVIGEIGVPKTASADQVFSAVTSFTDDAGKAISSAVKTANKPVNTSSLAQNIENSFSKVIGKGRGNAVADDIVTQVRAAKTPQELWQVRRNIDDALINFGRNPNSTVPGAEQLARTARNAINKELNSVVPGLGTLNKRYSTALEISDLVAGAAKTPKGVKLPGFLGSVGGQTAQRTRAGAGRLLGAGAAPKAAGLSSKGIAGRQVAQNLLLPREQQTAGQTPEQSLEDALMEQQGLGYGEPVAQESLSPYSKENLLYDIQRDPANAEEYIKLYQMYDEIFGAPAAPELNNTAIQTISDLQTGIDNLGLLEQRITESGANNPLLGEIRSRIPFDTDAKSLRAEIDRVKQVVGKALEGGVLRKEDEEKYARILPTINDTDEVAREKISAIRADLQNKLNTFYQNSVQYGGGGGSLENALMQYQGGF